MTHEYYPAQCLPRYPLELVRSGKSGESLHICLWHESQPYKWTIALVSFRKEGPEIQFCGDRPFDLRVNWEHFRELCQQAQAIANEVHETTTKQGTP